jgi:hypothetical protein
MSHPETTETPITRRIISATLHQIDVDNRDCKLIPITRNHPDLEEYLTDILSEISATPQKRAFDFSRETTEFFTTLKSYISQKDLDKTGSGKNFAKRLLEKEIEADIKYGHLGNKGKGHVNKGSFLQLLYRNRGVISYLGVKIAHQVFLDEEDFKKKIGLAIANKLFKACKVSFDQETPDSIHIYDTNTRPSAYWWKEFLELKELWTDSYNTRTAVSEVIKIVKTIKKYHPSDYTILRNSTIGAFKQTGELIYDEFITNTFENYSAIDKDLSSKIPKLVESLRSLPEKKNFDGKFQLKPSEVPYNQARIPLSREITISFNEGIDNLEDKIWAEKTSSGRKLVVIESPDGFDRFSEKKRTS